MGKYKPGDIITIKGTEFVVLDVEEGTAKDGKDKLFVLLKEPVGSTTFGTTNDYKCSTLRGAVDSGIRTSSKTRNRSNDCLQQKRPPIYCNSNP